MRSDGGSTRTPAVRACYDVGLLEQWRRLTTSDHLYYMATKWTADGDVHTYFSPYDTPYDAFIAFMNVMQDLEQRISAELADAREAGIDTASEWIGASTR